MTQTSRVIDGCTAATGSSDRRQPAGGIVYDTRPLTVGAGALRLQTPQVVVESCWLATKPATMQATRYADDGGPAHLSFAAIWKGCTMRFAQLQLPRAGLYVTNKSQQTNTIRLVGPSGVVSQSDDTDWTAMAGASCTWLSDDDDTTTACGWATVAAVK